MTWTDDFVKHWKYYLPPSRASPSELHFIKEKIIEKGKQAKILILGSTPEYRNLCGELKMPVTLLDFSRQNYEYLAREVKHKPKETFILGDWITTHLPHRFDIILGDNAINVVLKKDQLTFLKNVAKM